jgi:hypothetical protein
MPRRHRITELPVEIRDENGMVVEGLTAQVDIQHVAALDEDLDEVRRIRVAQIQDNIPSSKIVKRRVNDVNLSSDERAVPHAFGYVPDEYSVIVRGDGYWYESREPDTQYVYLKANTDVVADVIIKG